MYKTKTLGERIGFGFAIMVILLAFAVGVTIWRVQVIEKISDRLVELRMPTTEASIGMLNGINHSLAALRGWMILGQDNFKEERKKAWSEEINFSLSHLERLSKNWADHRNVERLKIIKKNLRLFEKYQKEIEQIALTQDNTPAIKILFEQAAPQAESMAKNITTMIDLEKGLVESSFQRKAILGMMADFRGSMGLGLANIRAYLLSGDEKFKKKFENLWVKNTQAFNDLTKIVEALTPQQRKSFETLAKSRAVFASLPPKMFKIRASADWNLANSWLGTKAAPIAFEIKEELKKMIDFQHNLESTDALILDQQINFLNIMEWLLLLSGTGLSIFLGLSITRSITRPIIKTVQFAKEIAQGNYSVTLDVGGSVEIESLGEAMNQMRGNLSETTDKMTKTMDDLNKANEEQQKQLWASNSRGELSTNMSGEEETSPLAHNIITCLSNLLDSSIGTLYVSDENQQLKLVASYAFSDRENNFNEFKPGEGLVGQAALEKKMIVFSDVPQDSAKINYGMGEVLPRHYLVTPILYEDMIKGVIVLGSVKEFTLEQREFVEKASNDVGITLSGAQSREKIELLLKETEEQSEILKIQQQELQQSNSEFEAQTKSLQASEGQLKIQQEELQATNEELEEQTKALQESEEKLKIQQEELQVTNEELEEKTKFLEKQRDEISSKNVEVEKARKEIEAKAKDLEEVSRYKSEFLANMSHELRTPLNSLLILAATLVDNEEKNLSADQIESIEVIHSSGNDLLSLINEILDLSKVESGKMGVHSEDIPLKDIIRRMEQNFNPVSREKKIRFDIILTDYLPEYIQTDRQKLEQILKNLLSNAFKFTSSIEGQTEEGGITVTISRPSDDIELKTSGLTTQNAIAFTISDDGIGISKDQHKKIFEAFQQVDGTTSRKYGGTGLGLSISREFAKLLGGEIVLQSIEGKGSTFTLCLPEVFSERNSSQKEQSQEYTNVLPLEQTERAQSIEQKSLVVEKVESSSFQDDRENISEGDKTILIIEDDTKFAKVLFDIAHKKSFKGLVAFNGETGLKLALEYQPKAIILDIMLPGIDGWVVMDRLKDNPQTRHIPVHFMSALEEEHHGSKKGAIGYLSKPVSKEQLDSVFEKMESFMTKDIKNLLIVGANAENQKKIVSLIESKEIKIVSVKTGQEAYEQVKSQGFDCMIVDGELSDIPVFELLKKIQEGEFSSQVPVIVYTDKELSKDEDRQLKQYAKSIIVRSEKSKERLLDETSLFLHCVESNFSEEQQKMIRQVHDKELILKDKTVLVVDDDMRNTFALSKALKAKGMNVLLAEDGKIALKMLDDEPHINIVLMDIMMPVMDGYEATRSIRKDSRFEKLPILALTAKAMGGDREKCIEAGANDYLSKPVDLEKLMSMLRVWLY